MPRERDLRRLVADLARAHPDDLQSVLDELDVRERQAVETLLKEYAGILAPANDAGEPDVVCDLSRLSPWLAERFKERSDISMTAHARAALGAAAARLYPRPLEPRAPNLSGWGGRFASLLSRRRAIP